MGSDSLQKKIHLAGRVFSSWTYCTLGLFALCIVLALNGCGGGSGSTAPAADSAPQLIVNLGGNVRKDSTTNAQRIAVGNALTMDASGSIDPDGTSLSFTWSITSAPSGSQAKLSAPSGMASTLVPDKLGTYEITLEAKDGQGAISKYTISLIADNLAPVPNVAASVVVPFGNTDTVLSINARATVTLDGSSSWVGPGLTASFNWVLLSAPNSSTATLFSNGQSTTSFYADLLGDYVVQMVVTDSAGNVSKRRLVLRATNYAPYANISLSSDPVARIVSPAANVAAGTSMILRGGGSTDSDGQALTYAWSLVSKPATSASQVLDPSSTDTRFTPDVQGQYIVKLRVTDTVGAFHEASLEINAGNTPPRLVLDSRVVALTGASTNLSAALSYDPEGSALTYTWSLDSKPAGSAVSLGVVSAATLSFTPDVDGTYVLSVVASDGLASSAGSVVVLAKPALLNSVALNFVPLEARHSRSLDMTVFIAANALTAHVVDGATGVIKTVALPRAPKALALSPNGRFAAVAHDAIISYIDVQTATLLRSVSTTSNSTGIFLTDSGFAITTGQTGGQWVASGLSAYDMNLGVPVVPVNVVGSYQTYGTTRGIYADRINKIFTLSEGLSPSDIYSFTLDPALGLMLSGTDSPYHGDYPMSNPLWLTQDQSMLLTGSGTLFRTSNLTYAGNLAGGSDRFISASHDAGLDEMLVSQSKNGAYNFSTYQYDVELQASYLRFTGAFFTPAPSLPMPLIGADQSYALDVFHSSSGRHVLVAQTGSKAARTLTGASYFLIYR